MISRDGALARILKSISISTDMRQSFRKPDEDEDSASFTPALRFNAIVFFEILHVIPHHNCSSNQHWAKEVCVR